MPWSPAGSLFNFLNNSLGDLHMLTKRFQTTLWSIQRVLRYLERTQGGISYTFRKNVYGYMASLRECMKPKGWLQGYIMSLQGPQEYLILQKYLILDLFTGRYYIKWAQEHSSCLLEYPVPPNHSKTVTTKSKRSPFNNQIKIFSLGDPTSMDLYKVCCYNFLRSF